MRQLTPIKAIRKNCLDCCGGSTKGVRFCADTECPLHIFRMGKNPHRTGIAPNQHLLKKKPMVESKKNIKKGASHE